MLPSSCSGLFGRARLPRDKHLGRSTVVAYMPHRSRRSPALGVARGRREAVMPEAERHQDRSKQKQIRGWMCNPLKALPPAIALFALEA